MSSSIPKTMKAYVIPKGGLSWPLQAAVSADYSNNPVLEQVPVPTPKDNELLIKVETFAANPTDVFHTDYIGVAGSIIGCDFVGTVVSAGSATSRHKVGDRLMGVVHGGKYEDVGSAAEYCVVEDELAMAVPEGMSNEDAATFGVGFLTAAGIVYNYQKAPLPPAKVEGEPWYFVSGGSTSVGLFAVQLAKLAGYRVIASCSPRSADLVTSYGADHVVDYSDIPKALEEIKRITSGQGISIGMDCVGGKANVNFAVDAFGPQGGVLTSILPNGKSHRSEVKIEDFLLYRYLGKAFTFIPMIMTFNAEPEKRAFLADFAARVPELITKYNIKPNPTDVSKGWETLPAGWDKLRKKQVSGKKLVFDLK